MVGVDHYIDAPLGQLALLDVVIGSGYHHNGHCGMMLAEGLSFTSVKYLLVLIFLWVSSPVSSHLIAQLEYRSRVPGKEER